MFLRGHRRRLPAWSVTVASGLSFVTVIALLMLVSDRSDLQERAAQAQAQPASTCSASDNVTPQGQNMPNSDGDPGIPAYCVPPPAPQAATRVSGANDWVDNFGVNGMARFDDGDMDY